MAQPSARRARADSALSDGSERVSRALLPRRRLWSGPGAGPAPAKCQGSCAKHTPGEGGGSPRRSCPRSPACLCCPAGAPAAAQGALSFPPHSAPGPSHPPSRPRWPHRAGLERCPACGSYYAQRRRKKSHCVWSRGPARVDHEKYIRLKEQYFKRHSQEFEFGFTTDSPIDLIYYTTASNVNKAVTHFSTDFTVR